MATYYLSTTGNDTTGDGSYATPWLTISKAHTSASAGDTIIYKNGTYSLAADQTFTKSLTIQAETAGSVILDFNNALYNWSAAQSVSMVFSGLVKYRWGCVAVAADYPIKIVTGSWTNCEFRACLPGGTGGLTYEGLIGGGTGTVTAYTLSLTNCLFNDVINGFASTKNIINPRGYGSSPTVALTLNNCTFSFKTNSSGRLNIINPAYALGIITVTVKNCIMYNATTGTNYIYFNYTTATTSYSCLYGLADAETGTGVITSDPLFVDAANSNFNLRPTSPCIGTGSA